MIMSNKSIIPIKNLFYMLCYAWNILSIKDTIKVGQEDFHDAYNLLGRIFSFGIGKLIRSGFHRSYIPQKEELATLRGKISVKDSISSQSMQHRKLVCEYDEYSTNDKFNQILKYTIDKLLKSNHIHVSIKKDLRKQAVFFSTVDSLEPTKANRKQLIFDRNNVIYKMLIHVAIMLYDNSMVNEDDGEHLFKDFFRDEQMQKVYENFLLNFYSMHLDKSKYRVYAPKFTWLKSSEQDIWDDEESADSFMPELRTDIVIENKKKGIQLIIDAKYYQSAMVTSHRSTVKKFRREHVSQILTYMINSPYIGIKRGALMYPTVEDIIDEKENIATGWIFFKSINLNKDWQDIANDLLIFAEKADRTSM